MMRTAPTAADAPATPATPAAHSEARRRLASAGLRVTRPRITVLAGLQTHRHASVETLAEYARAELGSVSKQAVYDVLAALDRAGLVRRIEPAGLPARYEDRVGDNHHHLVCRTCDAIVDVDCIVGQTACLTPQNDHGFVVDEAEVTFWGRCPDCAAAAS